MHNLKPLLAFLFNSCLQLKFWYLFVAQFGSLIKANDANYKIEVAVFVFLFVVLVGFIMLLIKCSGIIH
jgi:hypothetical protein